MATERSVETDRPAEVAAWCAAIVRLLRARADDFGTHPAAARALHEAAEAVARGEYAWGGPDADAGRSQAG